MKPDAGKSPLPIHSLAFFSGGFLGLTACGFFTDPEAILSSPTCSLLVLAGLSLGCFTVTMIISKQEVAGLSDRAVSGGGFMFCLMLLLFIPFFRLHFYPWARDTEIAADQ